MIFIKILFWFSVACLVHTYFIYPLSLYLFSTFKRKLNNDQGIKHKEFVSVIMAVYNEEQVIEKKIRSVLDSNYKGNLELIIGSDNSSDKTNEIIRRLQSEYPGLIKAFFFESRRGKSAQLNILSKEAKPGIFILTDANVYFDKNTINKLIMHFNDPETGIVGANIINPETNKDGISIQEKLFIRQEVYMKYYEGKLWGSMIGAFGGCYAIRSELLPDIPTDYAVEDFFITMSVLEKGKKANTELKAFVYEDVSNDWKIEYKRKVRISVGNFQNLKHFYSLLWPPYKGVSYAFFSHKVLRWFGPFLIIFSFISNIFLAVNNIFYLSLLALQLVLLCSLLIDFLLKKFNIHIVILRFISHFFTMNMALLEGFFKFLKGEHTNVWQPTKRNQ
ncbi:MAG: glycosyltransferase [Bacteroidales bacterium]